MKTHFRLIAAAAFTVLPATAFAQGDAHHQGDAAAQATPNTPAAAPMTGGLPDRSMSMMPMMQQMMRTMMMQQMMQMMQTMQGDMPQGGLGMAQGEMAQGLAGGMAQGGGAMSDASRAYMNAMKTMDGPMMQAFQAGDPDVAFVRAMIPHHQGAIEMARAVLRYGKDARVKEWANQIIKAQEAEIAAMQDWLETQDWLKQHAQ